jgi:hypothetical protein
MRRHVPAKLVSAPLKRAGESCVGCTFINNERHESSRGDTGCRIPEHDRIAGIPASRPRARSRRTGPATLRGPTATQGRGRDSGFPPRQINFRGYGPSTVPPPPAGPPSHPTIHRPPTSTADNPPPISAVSSPARIGSGTQIGAGGGPARSPGRGDGGRATGPAAGRHPTSGRLVSPPARPLPPPAADRAPRPPTIPLLPPQSPGSPGGIAPCRIGPGLLARTRRTGPPQPAERRLARLAHGSALPATRPTTAVHTGPIPPVRPATDLPPGRHHAGHPRNQRHSPSPHHRHSAPPGALSPDHRHHASPGHRNGTSPGHRNLVAPGRHNMPPGDRWRTTSPGHRTGAAHAVTGSDTPGMTGDQHSAGGDTPGVTSNRHSAGGNTPGVTSNRHSAGGEPISATTVMGAAGGESVSPRGCFAARSIRVPAAGLVASGFTRTEEKADKIEPPHPPRPPPGPRGSAISIRECLRKRKAGSQVADS